MNSLYPIEKPAEHSRQTKSGRAWQHMDDVRRYREAWDFNPTAPGVDCRTTPNVGDLMAAAMAAAGSFALAIGGSRACETDYLAASGAKFPETVTVEQMEAFNRDTLKPYMDEEDEWRRYAAIAGFWRRAACRTRIQ